VLPQRLIAFKKVIDFFNLSNVDHRKMKWTNFDFYVPDWFLQNR